MKRLISLILMLASLTPLEAATLLYPYDNTAEVVVLVYHHLDEQPTSESTTTPDKFAEHLETIESLGYKTISIKDMIAYVERGVPLPDKAVLITFDDGYMSNYEYAFPLLTDFGMKACIFTIGSTFGTSKYKLTGYDITPHFGTAEAREMIASGLIEVQSHSYDLHKWEPYEAKEVYRLGFVPRWDDTEANYRKILKSDFAAERTIINYIGEDMYAMAYPYGLYTAIADDMASDYGIKVTFTIKPHTNTIVRGDPSSLRLLGRFSIDDKMDGEDIKTILTTKKLPS